MKTYLDYCNEITSIELYDRLVGCGLFAEKIPNFLTSQEFLDFTRTLTFPFEEKPKDYIRYSNMRNINIPRPLSIPEPFAYSNQCKTLSDNWDKIKKHFEDKTQNDDFKISRIHIRKMIDKCNLFEMNYKNFSKDGEPEQNIVIKSRYIANADISNCFPSIYSHSIPWALVGKSFAKSNRASALWFNKLDFHTRNIKHGETNGVLIGPHASNLISEIILVAIDHELSLRGFKYIRNVDDYSCYVNSYEESERFFITLSEELKKYELSLNTKKSQILSLPQATVKNWVTKLNHFNFNNTYRVGHREAVRVKELKGFIDFCIELMIDENFDGSIINYAIKILSNKHLGFNAKDYYLKQIHHLVLLYPYLIHLLEVNLFDPHKIDKNKIKEIAKDIYEYGQQKRFFEACSYAVYWSLRYDFDLDISSLKEDSIKSEDCIFMLISYLYHKKTKAKSYLQEYKDIAKKLKIDDFDRYWLYIYEVLPWPELAGNYRIMKKNKLTFIKSGF
ncbi:Reverse transcriptase (RNA-dependent DNA polymerase) [Chryseobacterium oleae]|uniref:Reverse transcriptase (RNA-dependent DNA polymerase) n=1 Tax=Chryseobacterium oleae TaxID=491207 RepID=A0A1I4VKU2_CHROL|nr:RNA-directed DNA polymerase [Chryseobacterium oleae]SFN01821.1 Reverse transcriptase (RNA-dependent DNA polymerase) [Chryseobacterium oleae]